MVVSIFNTHQWLVQLVTNFIASMLSEDNNLLQDLSGFQGWVTNLFDKVFEEIASINDRIIQLQESNASTYGH